MRKILRAWARSRITNIDVPSYYPVPNSSNLRPKSFSYSKIVPVLKFAFALEPFIVIELCSETLLAAWEEIKFSDHSNKIEIEFSRLTDQCITVDFW